MTCDVVLPPTSQREMEKHSVCFVVGKINSLQEKNVRALFPLYRFSDSNHVDFLVICKKNAFF